MSITQRQNTHSQLQHIQGLIWEHTVCSTESIWL